MFQKLFLINKLVYILIQCRCYQFTSNELQKNLSYDHSCCNSDQILILSVG